MSHTPFPHISELNSFFGVFYFSTHTPISPICRTPLFPISQNVIPFLKESPLLVPTNATGGPLASSGVQSGRVEGSVSLAERLSQYRLRALIVGILCAHYSAYALLRRHATGLRHERWSTPSVLCLSELYSFCFSLRMIKSRDTTSASPPRSPILVKLRWLLLNASSMALPALLSLSMSILAFASLRRLSAGTYAVLDQVN